MKLNNNSEQIFEEEFNIILNSKSYEKDINSIFYFMNNFQKNYGKEDLKEFLSLKYKNLSEQGPEELKTNLKELKEKGIYDYSKENNNKSNYIKFFNCLFDKKQAYDFLLSKTTEEIELLYDKIEPNYGTISLKDINDASHCIGFFHELKKIHDFNQILLNIKEKMEDNDLNKRFENF